MPNNANGLSAGRSADDMAAYWKARQMSGNYSTDDEAAFQAWRGASPENAAAMAAYDALDHMVSEAAVGRGVAELASLADRQWRWQRLLPGGLAIAASLAAVLLIAPQWQAGEVAMTTYETSRGQRREVALDDGSLLSLNANTRLDVVLTEGTRKVSLHAGEALFDVARDAARPFVVTSGPARIAVLGTQFDVATRSGSTNVAVLSGVVKVVGAAAAQTTLIAGQRIVVDGKGMIGTVSGFDPATVTDWRDGKAQFFDTRLGDVLAELNDHFPKPVIPANDDIAAIPVTGTFDLDRPEATLAALEAALSLDAVEMPGGAIRLQADAD